MKKKQEAVILIVVISLITIVTGGVLLQSTFEELTQLGKEAPFVQSEVETILVDQPPSEEKLRSIYATLLNVQGKKEARNFYITKTKDDYLVSANYFSQSELDFRTYAKRMKKMEQALPEKAELLYVGTSGKFIPDVTKVRDGYPNDLFNDREMDELFLELSYYQIPTLDLRKSKQRERLKYQQNYYRSHSIWTESAAFEAAVSIMSTLQTKQPTTFMYEEIVTQRQAYTETIYPEKMRGDLLQATGNSFIKADDLITLTPKFKVDLSYKNLSDEEDFARTGDFKTVVWNPLQVSELKKETFDPTEMYYSKDVEHLQLTNNNSEVKGKLLLLIDDYFVPVVGYLALMAQEVEVMVIEENHASDIESVIASGNFDAIVVASQAPSLQETFFNFYK
uniref:alginate O-acetyltransferase AlgX-related protein n=1 Tax=Candidatus Enterococcus willemsii TaxID=1857215 RepID=UPI00403F2C87